MQIRIFAFTDPVSINNEGVHWTLEIFDCIDAGRIHAYMRGTDGFVHTERRTVIIIDAFR